MIKQRGGRVELVLCKRDHLGHKTHHTSSCSMLASAGQQIQYHAERVITKGVHHARRREVLKDFYGESIDNNDDFSLNY